MDLCSSSTNTGVARNDTAGVSLGLWIGEKSRNGKEEDMWLIEGACRISEP